MKMALLLCSDNNSAYLLEGGIHKLKRMFFSDILL